MKVQCDRCETTYNVKDEKIPDAGAKIKCPKCQNVMSVKKPETVPPALSSEDLTEDFGNEPEKTGSQDDVKSETKKCPFCAEEINVDAIKCKHCGSDLADEKTTSVPKKNTGELLGILMLCIPVVAAMLILFWVGSSRLIDNPLNTLMLIAVSTISITAILAAVEANQLGFGKSKSGKRENGPVGLFFGIILMWVIGYPYYLYQRSKKGKKNLLAGGLLATLLFSSSVFGMNFAMNGGMNPEISMVKNGMLLGHQEKTVGEAIDSALSEVQWNVIEGTDGNTYVNARGFWVDGSNTKSEKKPVTVQFRLSKDNKTFEINAVEAENRALSALEVPYFLKIIYNHEKFRAETACSMIESEANNTIAWIADYFADPSHINIPTIEDLKTEGYKPVFPVEIRGNSLDDISVLVINSNHRCPKGTGYLVSFEGSGKWIN